MTILTFQPFYVHWYFLACIELSGHAKSFHYALKRKEIQKPRPSTQTNSDVDEEPDDNDKTSYVLNDTLFPSNNKSDLSSHSSNEEPEKSLGDPEEVPDLLKTQHLF